VVGQDDLLVRAVRTRLDRILPQSKGMETPACAAWIEAHRLELTWNAAKGVYEGG
jgi:hypothetical protein